MRDPVGGRDIVMRIAVLAAAAMIVLALVMLIGLTVRRQIEGPPMNAAPLSQRQASNRSVFPREEIGRVYQMIEVTQSLESPAFELAVECASI